MVDFCLDVSLFLKRIMRKISINDTEVVIDWVLRVAFNCCFFISINFCCIHNAINYDSYNTEILHLKETQIFITRYVVSSMQENIFKFRLILFLLLPLRNPFHIMHSCQKASLNLKIMHTQGCSQK